MNTGTKDDTRYRVTSIGVNKYEPANSATGGIKIQLSARIASSRRVRHRRMPPRIANNRNNGNGQLPSPLSKVANGSPRPGGRIQLKSPRSRPTAPFSKPLEKGKSNTIATNIAAPNRNAVPLRTGSELRASRTKR